MYLSWLIPPTLLDSEYPHSSGPLTVCLGSPVILGIYSYFHILSVISKGFGEEKVNSFNKLKEKKWLLASLGKKQCLFHNYHSGFQILLVLLYRKTLNAL